MTPQQIKDNAPAGATHYLEDNRSYYKNLDDIVYVHNGVDWIESCFVSRELNNCFFQPLFR